MKNLNNIILAYDTDNDPMIINLDDICYVSENTCVTHDLDHDIDIAHNVEKFQELVNKANCEVPFIYLHDSDNNPLLVNMNNVLHIFYDKIVFTNNITINVIETVNNIYKKIQEYKSNNIIKYGNTVNTKVKTDSPGVINRNRTSLENSSGINDKNISDIDKAVQKVPKLVKLY